MQQESSLKRGGVEFHEFCFEEWSFSIGQLSKIGIVYWVDILLLFLGKGVHVPKGIAGQSSGTVVRRHCAIFGLMAWLATIKAEIHANAMLPFLRCKAFSTCQSSSASSVCSAASSSTSAENIDLCIGVGFFSLYFLNARVSTQSISIRTGKHSPVVIKFSSFFHEASEGSRLWCQKKDFALEGQVQGPPEGIHLGNFVCSSSPSMLAPFLVPFSELPTSLVSGMHFQDCFQLGWRRNELFIEVGFKGSPSAVVYWVLCQGTGNLIASPFSGVSSKFEMGKGSRNPGFFVGERSGIHGVIVV